MASLVSVLMGFACIIYLFIICFFAHSHRRKYHFQLKCKRLLELERGKALWWLECDILPTAREGGGGGGGGLCWVELEKKNRRMGFKK